MTTSFRSVRCLLTVCVVALVATMFLTSSALAGGPQFNILKPSTTGVPANEVRVMAFDPAGNLWIGGRVIQWQEWGVAMLPADQLAYTPLPGGGFDTGAWKVWSTVHGHPLPSQYMYDMEFSSDGTMWLASEAGLTRFRPNAPDPSDRWHTFTPANSPLLIDEVRSIAIDSDDNLWVSNASLNYAFSYLFKLNTSTGQWTPVPTTGKQPLEVAVGNQGHILISMKDVGGVMEFDGTAWQHYDALPRELSCLVQDAQGNIWAAGSGINGDGLWKWNGSAWQNWPTVGGTITVTGVGKDRDGVVYVSTWYGGIYRMINNTPVLFAAADNIPRSVIGRPNGDIWINNYGGNGTLGTVRHYASSGQLLTRMQIFNAGLPDYFVDRIRSDSSGNLWFMAGEGGMSRMLGSDGAADSSTHWRNFGDHNDGAEPYPFVDSEPIYSLLEDAGGVFWMGGNGVGRWDSTTGQFTNFWNWQNSNLDTTGVKALAKREGTMWAGMGGSGVFWLNGNDWTRVSLGESFDANHVNALAVDTANNLWVASNFCLRRFAPGNNADFTLYHVGNSPLPSDYILDLMADPAGGVWIGTTAGLVRVDGTNWTVYNQANTGMPGTGVSGITRRQSDGLLAVANNQPSVFPYTGGVSTFDGQTWTHYTPENSELPHWQVVDVEFDADGDLWASPMSKGVVEITLGRTPARTRFDYDGDGRADVSVYRPSEGNWYVQRSRDGFAATSWGLATDKIVPADYDGDGKTDIAVYRPSEGNWYILRSSNGTLFALNFGISEDLPSPGYFDTDAGAEIAVYRPSTGTWWIRVNAGPVFSARFGTAGDKPVVGDWDGDGRSDLGVFRPSNGTWYYSYDLVDPSHNFNVIQWGVSDDRVVPADYDGDGKTDVAVFRPSTGVWYIRKSSNGQLAATTFGLSTDIAVPADYDGDGRADVAVFRPADGNWWIDRTTSGVTAVPFGMNGDRPTPASPGN